MKKFVVIVLLTITVSVAYCQKLTCESVVKIDSTVKKELLLRCVEFSNFMQSAFRSAIVSDTLNATFAYQYEFPYTTNLFGASYINGGIRTTLHVYLKDGRYKYNFEQFEHIGSSKSYGIITTDEQCPPDRWEPLSSQKYSTKRWVDIKQVINDHVKFISNKLLDLMSKPSEQSKDW